MRVAHLGADVQLEVIVPGHRGFAQPYAQHAALLEGLNKGDTKDTFREHSGNIQGTFREHSGNMQGTFREGTSSEMFSDHSGRVERTPVSLHLNVRST